MGEEALGALMLFHREPDQFSEDKLEVVQATAKQIAVAINNAQLYSLIRDQAERLGNMLRTQQIEASRLRAILESVADGVLVTESNGAISLFNASAEFILGLSNTQVIGKSLDDFTGLFGKAGRTWTEKIRLWSADPTTYKTGDTAIERITLEDGRVVAVSLAPVGSRSEFLGTVSIFRDITHQVEVERMKSEFVATVSHELRTPMTSIRGYVDVLLMGAAGGLNEKQNEFLKVVQINTERLNVLVDDLLEVSHIESGKIEISAQIVDIATIIYDVVKNLEEKSREQNKSMQVNVEVPEEKPLVLGDLERIRQILENLVDNAYIYTPANGLISVKIHPIDGYFQIDIKDKGIGIAPEDQPRVFERFYRGEDPLVLSTAGTGLGLSIVQYLVELHGGDIWLESSGVPGDGSTFSFTLPGYYPDQ
jgi:PAS domain S-box-containing protein